MRIQETDRILKESRNTRRPVENEQPGLLARTWKMLSGVFRKQH